MDTKLSNNRAKKTQTVAKLADKTKPTKALVFANYQGMTHKQLEDLKKNLKATGGDMVVTKNTLLKIALKETGYKEAVEKEEFTQPTATVLINNDLIGPLKELAKVIKTLKLPVIKFGIVDGKVLNEAEIMKLSALPPREVLIAQVIGGMKAPLYGLQRALSWNTQRFVMTLKAIELMKS